MAVPSGTTAADGEQQCMRLRSLVHDCLAKHMYEAAAFFADKLVTLSRAAPADVYMLAQVYCCSMRYPNALSADSERASRRPVCM